MSDPSRQARLARLFESAAADPQAELRRQLDENARRAAQPATDLLSAGQRDAGSQDFVVVRLGGARFALETALVRSVERVGKLTSLPGTPEILLGVRLLRGRVLPVFDLGTLLGAARTLPLEHGRLLVLASASGSDALGFAVDAVEAITAIARERLAEAPQGTEPVAIRGVTADEIVVLDGGAILVHPALTIDQRAPRATRGNGDEP